MTTIIPPIGRDVPYMSQQLASLERAFRDALDVEVRFVDAAGSEAELIEARYQTPAVIVGMGVQDFTAEIASQLPDLRLMQTITASVLF